MNEDSMKYANRACFEALTSLVNNSFMSTDYEEYFDQRFAEMPFGLPHLMRVLAEEGFVRLSDKPVPEITVKGRVWAQAHLYGDTGSLPFLPYDSFLLKYICEEQIGKNLDVARLDYCPIEAHLSDWQVSEEDARIRNAPQRTAAWVKVSVLPRTTCKGTVIVNAEQFNQPVIGGDRATIYSSRTSGPEWRTAIDGLRFEE